jgi:hypothetical protein
VAKKKSVKSGGRCNPETHPGLTNRELINRQKKAQQARVRRAKKKNS